METRNLRKTRTGVVISNKMEKTIVIASKFKEMHPIYGKFVRANKWNSKTLCRTPREKY